MDRPIEIEREIPFPTSPVMGTLTANPMEFIYGTGFGPNHVGFEVGKFLYYEDHLCQVSSMTEDFVVLVGMGNVPRERCSVMRYYVCERFPTGIEIFPPRDRCGVGPEVTVTDQGYKIFCPKCGMTTRGQTYGEAFDKWYHECA